MHIHVCWEDFSLHIVEHGGKKRSRIIESKKKEKTACWYFHFLSVFLCDGLAAAAKAGFQFSKHLGFADFPCLLNVCSGVLHNKTAKGEGTVREKHGLRVLHYQMIGRKINKENKYGHPAVILLFSFSAFCEENLDFLCIAGG